MSDEILKHLTKKGVAFVEEALDVARAMYDEVRVSPGFGRRWRMTDTGPTGASEFQAEPPTVWEGAFDTSFRGAAAALPTATAFIDALESEDRTQSQLGETVGTAFGNAVLLERDAELSSLIVQVVGITSSFEFQREPTQRVVSKFVDDLAAAEIDLQMLIPVRGLSVLERFELLSGEVELRRIREEEIHRMLDLPGVLPDRYLLAQFDGFHTRRWLSATDGTCVATTLSLPKVAGEGPEHSGPNPISERGAILSGAARVAVTAVRLGWGGGVALGPLVTLSGTWRSVPFQGISWQPPHPDIPRFGEPVPVGPAVTLTEEDGPEYRRLIEALEGGAYDRWTIPLDRFRQVPTRSAPVDRLIDLFIAAEGLFFDEHEAEISYKLALRAALANPSDEFQPKAVFDFMRDAYSVRSKVVHGNRAVAEESGKWPRRLDGTRTDQVSDVAGDLEELMQAALLDAVQKNAGGTPPRYDERVGELLNQWEADT